MGRDRLVDQIAQAMARAENASEDHFEAYRHVAEAVAAVVEPLLAKKDKAAVEVVERLLRATMDNPDAGDLHLARHKAREFLAGVSPVSPDEPGEDAAVPVVTDEERAALCSACSKCGGLVRLELRCEVCGDLPAVEGAESWTEWRACWWDGLPASDWRRDRVFIAGVHLLTEETKGGAFIEQRTVWASRPVRVEEQGEEN